jgi:PIN domain nuclease of toxin-antitoxin system
MQIMGLCDTHAILWYVTRDPRLSAPALKKINDIVTAERQVAISSMSFAEIVLLVERGRIPVESLQEILKLVALPDSMLVEILFDKTIALAMRQIQRTQIPELPDRIIAATGLYLSVPVITSDRETRASGIPTVW